MRLYLLTVFKCGAAMSKFNGKKTNNAKTSAKKDLRQGVLSQMKIARVLEVFCGAGEMYNSVWNGAESYLGIDKVKFFDKRKTICGDAMKAVSTIDLSEFNVFDIDAYGSPYDVLCVILDRIQGDKPEYGFCITDGVSMDLRLGNICKGIRQLTGIEHRVVKNSAIMHDELITAIINTVCNRLNSHVTHFRIANGKTGAAMKYYAFVIAKNAA